MKKLCLLSAAVVLLVSSCQHNDIAAAPVKPISVVLVGDSTVATYRETETRRGWGQFMQSRFRDNVTIYNMARSGRSSKSYIDEGLWAGALAKKPDYVFIQFGHNDCPGKGPRRQTDPNTTYKDNLRRYIAETRGQGGEPIIVTPPERRKFDSQGQLAESLTAYAAAAREVAAEQNVFLVDLNAESVNLFNLLGEEATNYINCSPEDRTHWSSEGAALWADKVVSRLRQAKGSCAKLADFLK